MKLFFLKIPSIIKGVKLVNYRRADYRIGDQKKMWKYSESHFASLQFPSALQWLPVCWTGPREYLGLFFNALEYHDQLNCNSMYFFLIFYNSLKGLLIAYYFSKEAYSIGIKWEKNFHIHFCLRDHTIWTRPLKPFVLFQVKPNCSVI